MVRSPCGLIPGRVLLLSVGLAACGGRAVRDPGPDDRDDEAPVPVPSSAPSGAADAGRSGDSWGDGESLGECQPGFDRDRESDRSCNWLVGERCFEDKLEACACACPADAEVSTCYSGYPQQDGQVLVYCY